MATRTVRLFGDPVLRQSAPEVVDFDKQLRRLVADLHDTLYDEQGAGLAATQVGVLQRVFVWHTPQGDEGHLVNPVLEFPDEEIDEDEEGCLSIPGLYFDTRRRLNTIARGYDMHGRPLQVVGSGRLARVLQHETDHLDGVLFIDHLDPETRKEAMRAIRLAEWNHPARVESSPHPVRGLLS
jgi:peptide deformylase